MQEASLEEGPVLRLILDYFERAGHAECLVPLENYCRENVNDGDLKNGSFPLELAALRELSLNGKWEQVVQYLNAFNGCSDKDGLERCLYLAERQKYFEILHHIENNIWSKFRLGYNISESGELLTSKEMDRIQNLIQHQLSVLEGLSPSHDEFLQLNNLLTSTLAGNELNTCYLSSGRLETFYQIGEWVSKVLYLTVSFPKKRNKEHDLASEDKCSLLKLVAKGLLYEQCEKLCRLRCGEKEMSENSSKLLDLSSWIQQQPDSSFQITPAEIVLVVKPLKSKHARRKKCCSKQHINEQHNNKHTLSNDSEVGNTGTAVMDDVNKLDGWPTAAEPLEEPAQEVELPATPPQAQTCIQNVTSSDVKDEQDNHNKRNSSTPRNYKSSETVLQTSLPPSPIAPVVSRYEGSKNPLPLAEAKSECSRLDESSCVDDKKCPCRKSPKNNKSQSRNHVPDKQSIQVTDMQEPLLQATPMEQMLPKEKESCSLREGTGDAMNSRTLGTAATNFRHFNRQSTKSIGGQSESYQPSMQGNRISRENWPSHTATLLGTISDKQVVRSVAFSESGNMVAVGANSRTLRLCHTHYLLDQYRDPSELDAFYTSPQYHKSSIYCLAWFHDSVLASGSNDQSVRLLTCTQEHKISTNTPLEIHKGTIRDISFTPDGLLVSGGGRLPEVLVTDVQKSQTIASLTGGHADQILAVETLSRDIVASGSQDGTVCVWDLRSHDPISCTRLASGVTSLTPCGREGFVSAHIDGSCSVFDLRSQQCTATYTAHQGECRSVRTHPLHTWVLSGSYDGTICLANVGPAMSDATERVQLNELCRHSEKVIQCRWHPGGRVFASTGTDKKASFWWI